ncbi:MULTISPECIES: prolipoprotein diacylglyceryl transferase family protein [Desulfococcus]|jgi:hypothetical protein|uniref:Prolipoprotein diacylglyceryl transferase n=1 Tax=Desulfococcus multivorans DSM 2059 TaxID=1121405 RepID=S7VDG8_DESML|nr:prolipoprotein diacylglyceryl transferase family protein [Desulfococcus multivorans]AOY58233.1 conserved uncharacterized protein [Desulfococcus multivorans]AQV00580.1 prolipoprotein diacylglyceryl transferase [Desulfococcus multivorans]EPR42513.1 prolipoprotein diacylglyceryl transferase [Desulfococcus multivorans DSM 2059]MDX9818727.1 prolipoprotein diacylglyceryl transferase [Desulfococcus multivorans]SJZ97056.1 Prolipoprotein diacylglyceryl transferase [Desulfococcus multivorans DSM 2059
MTDELFILGLTLLLTLVFSWGFKTLPSERWQILAVLPRLKHAGGWQGENLTFYGLFNANAYGLSVVIFIILMGSVGAPLVAVLAVTATLLGVCIPASRTVAGIVEKKRYTFTIGGASFVGILIAPWLVAGANLALRPWVQTPIDIMIFMAALTVSYAFGEGVGRLACISFGCCYGKPLKACHPLIQRFFSRKRFVFSGKTKKIAYADGWDGVPVVPIQAVTAVIYCSAGIAGIYLFLKGFPTTAFFESLVITQVWRSVSEVFRADYRGRRKFSTYQVMALGAVAYAAVIAFRCSETVVVAPEVLQGMKCLWHPAVILALQVLWMTVFLYTGRSKVTESHLSFHVIRERI